MRRHARNARSMRGQQASDRERREHAVRVDQVDAAVNQRGAQLTHFPQVGCRHVSGHARLDCVDRHAGHRARIDGGGEEVHHVASRREGLGEAGHVTFNATNAGRTPVRYEADRERLDDSSTPGNGSISIQGRRQYSRVRPLFFWPAIAAA